MPTRYVEGVPEGLYEALRARAQKERTSISVEVLKLLAAGVPTEQELARQYGLQQEQSKAQSLNVFYPYALVKELVGNLMTGYYRNPLFDEVKKRMAGNGK